MSTPRKTVLLTQSSKRQGEIWYAALTSQQLSVIWEAAETDVLQIIQQMQSADLELPDLLIVDLGMQDFNPYAFCRTCREDYPTLKIILTAGQQTEIDPTERRWAIFQGAQDFLPGIQATNLITGVIANLSRVMEILGLKSLNQAALMSTLSNLAATDTLTAEPPAPADPLPAPDPTPPPTSEQYRGATDFEDIFSTPPQPPGPPPTPKISWLYLLKNKELIRESFTELKAISDRQAQTAERQEQNITRLVGLVEALIRDRAS